MIYFTAEVRWFWPGDIPPLVLAWLSSWPVPPEEQPARVDHYLRLPEPIYRTVGIKRREGRLEIKSRQSDQGLVCLAPDAWGRLELWRKEISTCGEAGELSVPGLALGHDTAAGDSVAVHKSRYLAGLGVTREGQVTADPPPGVGAAACEFEVTRVQAWNQVWWTACFEAFGAGQTGLEATLARVAAHVLASPHPLSLDAEHSASYPQWLAALDANR